jgi:hypothetical protein
MLPQSDAALTGTILVADDQESNRELIKELLSDKEFEVIAAPDGTSALEKLTSNHIDVVLLDVMMPHVTGWWDPRFFDQIVGFIGKNCSQGFGCAASASHTDEASLKDATY